MSLLNQEIETFYPQNREQWRQWLVNNHNSKASIWVVFYKIKSAMPTISWSEAVDEALCFGWVDSRKKPVDDQKYIQFYCKRKAASTWSKINKEKIARLLAERLIQPAGLASIETAQHNGSWNILDDVEELKIPVDLEAALLSNEGAMEFYLSLSKSKRKQILQWLVLTKVEKTRQKRIDEIAGLAAQKKKPKWL